MRAGRIAAAAAARSRAFTTAVLLGIALVPLLTLAQLSPPLQRAVDWLAAQVQSAAVSGEAGSLANPVQVRGETVQTLRLLSRLPAPLADAVYTHDDGAAQIDTETLARRVLAGVPNARDVSALLQSLRERRNGDGGFGGAPGYASSVLDTAWAVLALAQAGQGAAADAAAARQYLASRIDGDGGVRSAVGGVRGGAGTRLYASALASLALQTHGDGAEAVRRLTAYLGAQQGADGGWAGDAVVTAWVLQALSAVSSDSGMKSAAASFLLARQSGDGSWSGDPYVTAVAIRALTAPGASSTGDAGIAGFVHDAQSGLPLEGASVAAVVGNNAPLAGVSDARGRFALLELAAGSYTLTVSRPGYQTLTRTVALAAAQTADLGQLRLLPQSSAGLVRGTVTATDGTPLAGAAVQLSSAAGNLAATTDAQGRYEFSAAPPGAITLAASLAGYRTVNASAALQAGQTLQFSPALPRDGEVIGADGQFFGQVTKTGDASPLAGASIVVSNTASGAEQTLTAAADGRFAGRLAPGTYVARYAFSGYSTAEQRFVLTAGTNVNAGVVALSPLRTASDVRGRVRDSAGNAIAGATVQVLGSSPLVAATSAPDGSYWLANAGATSISLRASATGYNAQSVVLQTPVPTELVHDFALVPQSGGAVRIDAFAAAPTQLPGQSLLSGNATLRNTGTERAFTAGGFVVLDARSQVVAQGGLLDSGGQPLGDITLDGAASVSVRVQWNTAQFAPGAYQLVLRLIEPGSRSQANPGGNLLVERAVAFEITARPAFAGTLTVNPPVMHATQSGSTAFTATLQNAGNVDLAADTYRLDVRDSASGATVLTRNVSGPVLAPSALATLDFGTWSPAAAGDYSVTVVSASDATRGLLQGKLYVGDASTGTFSVDRTLVPTGTQQVRATVTVKGEDVAGSISDPLAAPIKAAIQRSVTYGDLQAANWAVGNRCLGCHTVSQALVGGELTRRFTTHDELSRNTLFNAISTYRQANGAIYASHEWFSRTQTMLGLWALNAWHQRDSYASSLAAAADYVTTTQESTGAWSADYGHGWWISQTTNTAFNLKSLVDVAGTLKRVAAPVNYTPAEILADGPIDGAYSLAHNDAGQILVANYYAGSVVAVNRDGSSQPLMTLANPYGLLAMPDGALLVASPSGVWRRSADGTVALFGPLPGGNLGPLTLAPDGRVLMAANAIYAYPGIGGEPTLVYSGPPLNGPAGLAHDAAGNLIVTNYYNHSIVRIRRSDNVAEVVVRWTNGNPRSIVREGSGWLVGTANGVFRYNADWQAERLSFGRAEAVDLLDDGTIVTGDWQRTISRLVPGAIDSAARIAAYTAAIQKATDWLLVDGNTDANNTMHMAHRLIGLGAARGFYAGTPMADTLQARMAAIGETLRARQRADGGWGQYSSWGSDAMVTAMVGYALDALNPTADDPVVRNAIVYLLGRQQADGSWLSENGILSTRLAATTWVEIWLPVALDRIGGIDTRLALRLPPNIALTNPTVAPATSSVDADGSSSFAWALNAVTSSGRELQFDLTLAAMQPDETRPAASAALLTFTNSFTQEALEAPIAIPSVRASAFLGVAVRTDRPSYPPDHPVIVSAPVVNGGAAATAPSVRLAVLAPGGAVLADLGTFAAGSVAPGATQTVSALWNSGRALAGSGYQARAVLLDAQGREVASAQAPFAVVSGSGQAVSARIVADRATYAPSDTVRLSDTVRNLTSNGVLENLVVHTSLRDAGGGVVWQTSQPVAQLVGGAVKELLYSVALSGAAAGRYSAGVDVKDAAGVTLASAATAITVSDSASTGAGLRGTLEAVPAEVPAGEAMALNWSISNAGNTAFAGLAVEVRILDPLSGRQLAAVPATVDLALGQTASRSASWTTLDSHAGKTLVAALTAQLAGGASVTLAQDNFRVIESPIRLELGIRGQREARVLALVSCTRGGDDDDDDGPDGSAPVPGRPTDAGGTSGGSTSGGSGGSGSSGDEDDDDDDDDDDDRDDPECLRRAMQGLRGALAALGVEHSVVDNKADFARELRSGRYNTYWISGGSHKLDERLVKEVRAAVQRGQGLVLDGEHDSRNRLLHPVAGVRQSGKLAQSDQDIQTLDGSLFVPGRLATLGRPTVFVVEGAQVHARFTGSGRGQQQPAPAILVNDYGAGRSVLYAFELVRRLGAVPGDAAQLDLVRRALGHLGSSDDTAPQYGMLASALDLANSGTQAAQLHVQAALPAGVRLISASAEAGGPQPDAQGRVNWRFALEPAARRSVVLRVALDGAGPYEVPVTVQAARIGSSTYTTYASGTLTLRARTLATAAQDAITAIAALRPAGQSEANAKSRAASAAASAQRAGAAGQFAQALDAWLDAADELLRIGSVDTRSARTAVARAVQGAELALQRQLGLP